MALQRRTMMGAGLALSLLVGCGALEGPATPRRSANSERADEEPLDGTDSEYGKLEARKKSKFSTIHIRKLKSTRTLLFVRDNGEEVVESMVDLDEPKHLLIDYTRYMFTSYFFRPRQARVLIVGLGGGSMVHFLKHHDPKLKVDVVEIDPVIVELADKYFKVKTGGAVKIHTKDAFDYLKNTKEKYDVIYMDAFLKPSDATDTTGVPLRLKTINFYKDIQKKLTADGLVVFNINPHAKDDDDLKNIKDAFPQSYVFALPDNGGYVAVGSMTKKRMGAKALRAAAEALNKQHKTRYSYLDMVDRLEK